MVLLEKKVVEEAMNERVIDFISPPHNLRPPVPLRLLSRLRLLPFGPE